MATSANLPSGAVAANELENDPFTTGPAGPAGPSQGPTRYASFDTEQFSTYSTNSPSQARRALEAHLKDTDRRIQDASKLGTTLLQQRQSLASRLKEVEELSKDNDVPLELQQKLTALEKEYNDIGRESARAFLPKSKPVTGDGASVYSSSGRESPTKAAAPSRRQRNQPSNRVHDIEFATEISTQLLAQVRQLQSALAEKDEELKDATASKSKLEDDHANLVQRAKSLDENLQRHRDDNWNLETKIQDLETSMREHGDREQRLNQTLKSTQTEKSTAQRDLDELKVLHEKAIDEHTTNIRHQEADLHTLRRDAANHESEKQTLHKRIDELTGQNTELAKAVSYRINQGSQPTQSGAATGRDSDSGEGVEQDIPEFISPVKGTPARAGMLESETLKSSLNHAHRMIQNLKNNIHREKTEKVELKRMLAEARDEIEKRRDSTGGVTAANMSRKRSEAAKGRKQPVRLDRLGATRTSTTEIIEDEPEWEETDGPITPSKSLFNRPAAGAAAMPGAFQETDTSDAFETADERRGDTATETEAFQTGAESFGEDSDLTETEDVSANRPSTATSRKTATPNVSARPGMPTDRFSYQSTASISGGEEDEDVVRTPVQAQGPKYRLRVSRGGRNSSGPTLHERLTESPASSMGGTPHHVGQSLGDELDALDDDDEESVEGTPNSRFSASPHVSPEMQKRMSVEPKSRGSMIATEDATVAPSPRGDDADQTQHSIGSPFTSPVKSRKSLLARDSPVSKPAMVDSGMMTEPWAPEKEIIVQHAPAEESNDDKNTAAGTVAAAASGVLAGVGLGRFSQHDNDEKSERPISRDESSSDEVPAGLLTPAPKKPRKESVASAGAILPRRSEPVVFSQSGILSQETEPIAMPVPTKATIPLHQSEISSQETEPIPAPVEKPMPAIPFHQSEISSQQTVPVTPPRTTVRAPLPTVGRVAPVPFQQSNMLSQETEPVSPPRNKAPLTLPLSHYATIAPIAPAAADAEIFEQKKPQELGFSAVSQQDIAPVEAEIEKHRPLVPRRSSRRLDMLCANTSDAEYDTVRASAPPGLFGTDTPAPESRSRSLASSEKPMPVQEEPTAPLEPKVYGGGKGTSTVPILTFGGDDDESVQRQPSPPPAIPEVLTPMSAIPHHLTEHERAFSSDSMIPMTKPLSVKRPMAESGSQTEVSGDDIERMIRDKRNAIAGASVGAIAGAGAVGVAASSMRRSVDSGMSSTFQTKSATPSNAASLHAPRQSASVGSMRSTTFAEPPPLPSDHNKRIAAAAQQAPISPGSKVPGTMGPPVIPASAYKHREARPKTPVGGPSSASMYRPVSKDSVTPRPSGRSGSGVSRQASVSSFASELDERFNIQRGQFAYPADMPPTTDPRMIQAITQTMIGEYLWKYTRKTGRNETSNSRHKRFFWVHPYTRTLYWSERDPSNSGKDMMKAKSMSIEAVRVITDDNTNPPGLHRKSIVVLTPGREIVFTAPTSQRHETWFNALSYLLLRTEQERHEAEDTINEEDIDEFAPPNPGSFSFRRSVSRMTGRSQTRRSMSSYNSRSRPASPTKETTPSHTARPTLNSTPTLTPTAHDNYASSRSRLSSFTTKLRTGSQRGSFNSAARPGAQSSLSHRSARTDDVGVEGSGIYNASVVSDSAEDLRAVIEGQEGNIDRLENVRACCDGKHDVGSLNRSGRHKSFTRSARGHSHGPPVSHSHGHGHPRAEPMKESQRPRRGE